MSLSGTRAEMICVPPRSSCDWILPRRDARAAIPSPRDFHALYRFNQHGLGFLGRVLERHRAGNLERHFRRVHFVIRAVVELDADIVDRVTGEDAARERCLDALVDRLDVFLGNRPALDVVLELVAGARRQWNEADLRLAELAAAAGLADEKTVAN